MALANININDIKVNGAAIGAANGLLKLDGEGKLPAIDGSNLIGIPTLPNIYGYGTDGDVTITDDTTLTQDMNYTNLTINSGVILNPNGYKIFVSGTLTNNGEINRDGNNGKAGYDGDFYDHVSEPLWTSGGLGGAVLNQGTIGGCVGGLDGGKGGGYYTGEDGGATSSIYLSYNGLDFSNTINGSEGLGKRVSETERSTNFGNGGKGGLGVSFSLEGRNITSSFDLGSLLTYNLIPNGGGGGGGGYVYGPGDDNDHYLGGGGGGSGGSGGVILISARNIDNTNGIISAKGGRGGRGGKGYLYDDATKDNNHYEGNGGSAAGGNGGICILISEQIIDEGSIVLDGGLPTATTITVDGTTIQTSSGYPGIDGKLIKFNVV